jgi:Ca2+:H+ antiporter
VAIGAAGLPKAFVGVVIALIVLMPEGLAAIKSALRNRLQNSINLALGSAIASIGLTIPTVALVSIVLNRQIALGVSQTDMTLLILTLYISALTLGTGRTTVLRAPCISLYSPRSCWSRPCRSPRRSVASLIVDRVRVT